MSPSRYGFILFSGANDRAILALCRAFTEESVDFAVFAMSRDDYVFDTNYRTAVVYTRQDRPLTERDLRQGLAAAQHDNPGIRWVICPTSEYLTQRLFDHETTLQEFDCEVVGAGRESYLTLTNKQSFADWCRRNGFDVPNRCENQDPTLTPLPFVAKPKRNVDVEGRVLYPHLIVSERERGRFLEMEDREAFFLEQFVHGQSYYLLFYFNRAGNVTAFSQQNILQQGAGKSIIFAKAVQLHHHDLTRRFITALETERYQGFIMVELRHSPEGKYYVIEANPRCWGPLQLTRDSGAGLLEEFFRDYGYFPPAPRRRSDWYLWSGGAALANRQGLGITWHTNERWREVFNIVRALFVADVYLRRDSWKLWCRETLRTSKGKQAS